MSVVLATLEWRFCWHWHYTKLQQL